MRGGQTRILSGPPPRFGSGGLPQARIIPQPKGRARSQNRLRPAPVEKPVDDLPSMETMLDALKVPAISPNISYSGTPPLVKRRLEDELVVNHRALLQSGLKCQQDWKLDAPALTNMTHLVASIIVQQLHGPMESMTQESDTIEHIKIASAELQKMIIDLCLIVARDLDALIAMADAVDQCESRLHCQAVKLDLLREEIKAKQKVRKDLEACNSEAETVLAKETVSALDQKCQTENLKVQSYSDELRRRKALHEERIANFLSVKNDLESLLNSLRNTAIALTIESDPSQDTTRDMGD